jgi:hypothetical protein
MATFFNQATLSFRGRLTNSNITVGEIRDTVSITKTALSSGYNAGSNVVYALNINNSGTLPITVSVTDNLGEYTVGNITVFPLDYVAGSARIFVNGIEESILSVTSGPPLVFEDVTLPAASNVQIYYEATVNGFAPIAEGSTIVNEVTLVSGTETLATSSAIISSSVNANLTIAKAVCPAVVTDNGELTYTFVIQNSGNEATVATDDIIVTDVFDPVLSNITVTFNGVTWTEGINYTYDVTTGEFATLPGQITVPAATYTQDTDTGLITTTPGVAVVTVSGTV